MFFQERQLKSHLLNRYDSIVINPPFALPHLRNIRAGRFKLPIRYAYGRVKLYDVYRAIPRRMNFSSGAPFRVTSASSMAEADANEIKFRPLSCKAGAL